MTNTREKLIELIHDTPDVKVWPDANRKIADHLIANGVTVGDKFATTEQQWISVKDRLPDKHDRYLCNVKAFSFPDLRYFAILKYDDGGFIEGKIYTDDVTHWMPLPQPPKGE